MPKPTPAPERNQNIRIGVTCIRNIHYACWKRDGSMHVYVVKGWTLLHSTSGDREAFDALCVAWGIEPVGSKAKAKRPILEPII